MEVCQINQDVGDLANKSGYRDGSVMPTGLSSHGVTGLPDQNPAVQKPLQLTTTLSQVIGGVINFPLRTNRKCI